MQVDRASTSVNATASANLLSESRSGANIARDFTRRGVAAGSFLCPTLDMFFRLGERP
jgi:hypothetical protein